MSTPEDGGLRMNHGWRQHLVSLNETLRPFRHTVSLTLAIIVVFSVICPDFSRELNGPAPKGKAWQYSPETRTSYAKTLRDATPADWKRHYDYLTIHPSVQEVNAEYGILASSSNSINRDIGNLGVAVIFWMGHENLNASASSSLLDLLDRVVDHDQYRWHYLRGLALKRLSRFSEARVSLEREMALHQGKSIGPRVAMAEISLEEGNTSRTLEILMDQEVELNAGEFPRRAYYTTGEWARLFRWGWRSEALGRGKFSAATLLAAVFSLLLWFNFLRWVRLECLNDTAESGPGLMFRMVLTFILGALSSIFFHPLVCAGLLEWMPLTDPDGASFLLEWRNYLTFYFFKAGIVEELVKLLPLLFICLLPRVVKEPVDYLVYGSCSALGFAFLENLSFFSNPFTSGFVYRGIICCSIHMACSSLVGFGLIPPAPGRYRFPRFLQFFALAALLHCLYDISCSLDPVFRILVLLVFWALWRTIFYRALSMSALFQAEQRTEFRNIELTLFQGMCLMMGAGILAQSCFRQPMVNFVLESTEFASVCLFPLIASRLFSEKGTEDRKTGRDALSRFWNWILREIEARPMAKHVVFSGSCIGSFAGLVSASLTTKGLEGLVPACFFAVLMGGAFRDYVDFCRTPYPAEARKLPNLLFPTLFCLLLPAVVRTLNHLEPSLLPELWKVVSCALIGLLFALLARRVAADFPINNWTVVPLGFLVSSTLVLGLFVPALFFKGLFGVAMALGGLAGLGPHPLSQVVSGSGSRQER